MIGVGVETVGTDAGAAHSFDPAFPCHSFLMGSGKYGLTQLQNLASLPPTGAVLVVGPLPIVTGSGRPRAGRGAGRALTIGRRVADAVGRALVDGGIDHVFGVVGSGNFHVTNAMVDGRRPVRRRPARGRCGDDGRRLRAYGGAARPPSRCTRAAG